MQVDFLHALNLAGLDETTELGDGLPLLLLVLVASTTATAASTSTTAITTVSATGAETTATRRARSTISHFRGREFDWKMLVSPS